MTSPAPGPHVLLLAGARETAQIAGVLAEQAGKTASVFWPDARPDIPPLPLPEIEADDRGGEGLAEALAAGAVTHLIDVSHPFADATSRAAAQAAAAAGATYARYARPPWTPKPGDDWSEVEDATDAAHRLRAGARVFATTGRESLRALAAYEGTIFLRQTSTHNETPTAANTTFVFGKPPFSVEEEVALFTKLRIDILLARNTGGTAGASKLAAARVLGLPMMLIRRPVPPGRVPLQSPDDVLDWLRET